MMSNTRCGMLALVALLAATPVHATAVRYAFETGPFSSRTNNAPSFQADSFVSGEIDYDADAPQSSAGPGGTFVHLFASGNLAATVQGFDIFDPIGGAVVGDEQTLTGPPGGSDLLVLNAEPQLLPTNIVGFELNGYRLVNVRLFWLETLFGAPDFLSSSTLPATLPSFAGRLALDFVPVTGGPVGFAFFDGLRVRPLVVPTPEPGSLVLLGLGLAGLAIRARRRS